MDRILIATNHAILGEAIAMLLERETGMLVKQVTPIIEDGVNQVIAEFRPTVIVAEEDLFGSYLTGTDMLSSGLGGLHVIKISSEHNQIVVDDRYWIPMAGLEDLMALVKGINGIAH